MPETHCSSTPQDTGARTDLSGQDERRDRAIMGLLLSSQPPEIWTADALESELREPLCDSLEALHGHGLLYRWDDYGEEFVLVARPVAHYDQLMTL
ncbi:MAG: hypothetical protein ACRDK7_01905 [Solirubrobacteraceae bacterium]